MRRERHCKPFPLAPMDESKIALPAWLPWATTACLAALVACLGELWIIERARAQMLRDQNLLIEAALKAADNQLEAERILSRRELGNLEARSVLNGTLRVAILSAPESGTSVPPGPVPARGAVAWDSGGDRAMLRLSGLPRLGPGRDYQLWLEGPGPAYPASCGTFHETPDDGAELPVALPAPVAPGCRFLLTEGVKGGVRTLVEAKAAGPIILATVPAAGKISN